jgi:hypothetical protein
MNTTQNRQQTGQAKKQHLKTVNIVIIAAFFSDALWMIKGHQ